MKEDPQKVKRISQRRAFFLPFLWILLFSAFSCYHPISKTNPYGLDIISDIESYNRLVAMDSSNAMVNINILIPGIVVDLKYATRDNFIHRKMYEAPEAYVRKPVGEALTAIQDELGSKALGLKIYDAYRPYTVTLRFWELYSDTLFVAAPWKGSRHNRGCAVDVSLMDLKSGKELEMPTKFDDFSEKASQSYMALPEHVLQNRQILKDVMMKNGFIPLEEEWWHYDFQGWEKYHLMDVSFRDLKNK
ncbi:MAG: M15 family metallopeptidase [Bacteroidales bacterium]|nr:M15 family metallopeptidase [Bacteroidales bacterium]